MKLFLGSILFFIVASFSPLAFGQTVTWVNSGDGSGSFDDPTKWTDANGPTVPGPANLVGIFPGFVTSPSSVFPGFIDVNLGGSSTITITTVNNQNIAGLLISGTFVDLTGNQLVASNPLATLNFNSGSTLTVNSLGMEVLGNAVATFNGNLNVNGDINIGAATSAIDPTQVSGNGTLILGPGTLNNDGNNILEVGNFATGALTQNSGSQVITGTSMFIGDGASGTWTVNSGAELDIGDTGAPGAGSYSVEIGNNSAGGGGGAGVAGTGLLTISGNFQAVNDNTSILLGLATGSLGTITQTTGSTVNISGNGSTLSIGALGGTGVYNLNGGSMTIGNVGTTVTVNLGDNLVLAGTGSNGTFTQIGGTLTTGTATNFNIGQTGTGTYSISGDSTVTATFGKGFVVGNLAGSTGTFNQSGGVVTASSPITVGNAGDGTYNMTGGTFNANGLINIGTGGGAGTFNYRGGTLNANLGLNIGGTGAFNQMVSLAVTQPVTVAAGGAYNLVSGTLATGGTVFSGAGNLNLSGGTLAVTGATFVDPLDGVISGAPTIDTTGGNANLNGNLSGIGTLNVKGGGTVTASGTGSGAWGVNIFGDSTFTAASAASLASSTATALKIGSGSTLNILDTGNASDTFAGAIANVKDNTDPAGTAQFRTGTNKLILTGNVNLDNSSTTTIGAGGSLRVDKGTISNIDGSAGNAGDTFEVGDGTTTGLVNLLGNNIIPNAVVNAGSTLVAGNINGSVTNAGTLRTPGTTTAPAPLLISGNLTSTGTLVVHSTGVGTDSFGTLANPMASATLSGLVDVIGFGTRTVPIVITSGGVTATIGTGPGQLTTNPGTALFSTTLTNTGNQIVLNTVQNALGGFATTTNEAAVAGALDPVINSSAPLPAAFAPVLTSLNRLSASQIPGALEALTPQSLQYSRIIAFENSTFLTQRVSGFNADIRNGLNGLDSNAVSVVNPVFNSSLGRSMKSLLASNGFHDSAPNGVNYYPGGSSGTSDSATVHVPESSPMPTWDPSTQTIVDAPNPYLATQHPNGVEAPGFTEFISGDIILADLNQDLHAANAPSTKGDYTAVNATAGIAYRFNSHFSAGALFDYSHTDAATDGHGSKTLIDTYTPGLFATYFDHGFYANGLFAFGYNQYDNSRAINFLGEHANSSPEGQQYTSSLDVGYDFHPAKQWVVGPVAGVTWTHLDINEFQETGAQGANLAVESQEADSVRSRLGGHVMFQANTGDILLQPNITAVWQHEYLNDSSAITSNFADFSTSSFTINTTAPSRDSALLGVGLTATLSTSMIFYFNYMADVGANNYFAQTLMGGFKTSF